MARKQSWETDTYTRWAAVWVIGVLLILPAGCGRSGPRTYPVSGTVTFGEADVPDGYITFTPVDSSQGPDSGEIKNGRFAFRAKAGSKKVEIQASRFVGPENPVMGLRHREQYIPEKYNIHSILTAEVTPGGDNTYRFALDGQ